MNFPTRVVVSLASAAFLAVPLLARDQVVSIPNWPAPLLWKLPARKMAGGPKEPVRGVTDGAALATVPTAPLIFVGVTPCRIADTRGPVGDYGAPPLSAGAPRDFTMTGQCGIPVTAAAASLNFTVTTTTGPGDIRVYPQGIATPLVSTLNYIAGQTVANAAIVPLGTGGGISVLADSHGANLIIDTNGYYAAPAPAPSGGTTNRPGGPLTACTTQNVLQDGVDVAVPSTIYAAGFGTYDPNGSNLVGATAQLVLRDFAATTTLAVSAKATASAGLTDQPLLSVSGFLQNGTDIDGGVFVAPPGNYGLSLNVTNTNGSCSGTPLFTGISLTFLLVPLP